MRATQKVNYGWTRHDDDEYDEDDDDYDDFDDDDNDNESNTESQLLMDSS